MKKNFQINKILVLQYCILFTVLYIFSMFSVCKWKILTAGGSFIFILIIMCKKKKDMKIFLYIIGLLIAINFGWNLFGVKKMMMENNVFYLLRNTQSYFYNDNYRVHKDCLIHILLRDKTAVVQNEGEWFYRYIEMFSGDTVIDESVSRIEIELESLENVGQMHMVACQDLFSEQVWKNLTQKSIDADYQNLYVELQGFLEADDIVVLSDDDYNLYLVPYEE